MKRVSGEPMLYEFANAAAEQVGLDVTFPELGGEPNRVAELSADGLQWVAVTELDVQMRDYQLGRLTDNKHNFLLRGLLTYRSGHIEAVVDAGVDNLTYKKQLTVSVLNSYEAVEKVQRALGQTPGHDAFKLQPLTRGQVTGGNIIEGATELILHTSTYDDLDVAKHDLRPDDHVVSWLCMPDSVAKHIQSRAKKLKQQHGGFIHKPPEDRPTDIGRFIGGIDNWQNVIKPIFYAVRNLETRGYPGGSRFKLNNDEEHSPLTRLHRAIHLAPSGDDELTWYRNVDYNRHALGDLGMFTYGMDEQEKNEIFIAVNKATAVRTAEMHLKLDEVKSIEYETAAARIARTNLLKSVVERYAA